MYDEGLRDEINKRLTLNWLIQGASQHVGMTLQHLVRDELDALDPRLRRLYDKFALVNLLQYWRIEAVLLLGWPGRFWKRAASTSKHPFSAHPILSKYGGMLAAAAKQRAVVRSKEKGLSLIPILFAFQAAYLILRLPWLEAPHRSELIELAKRTASAIWGITIDRLDGRLVKHIELGNLIPARTLRDAIFRIAIVGYGGVERRGDSLVVVARGTNWLLLTKELVKGTAELICLHGLNRLDDETYRRVVDATDRLEFEPWMLQTGGELWRRLLVLIPPERPVAEVLMRLARLPAKSLESLVLAVIERPEWARELLSGLGDATAADELE
jgi:hypothetical protein